MENNSKKTVVYVFPSGGIGGAEQYLYNFLANFQSNKYRAYMLFLFSGGTIADEIKSVGIETTILGIRNGFDLFSFIKFYKYVWKTNPAILHFHGPCITARLIASLFPSIIKINTDHGPSYHSYYYRKKRQAIVSRLLTFFTDHYIAISKVMVKTLIQYSRVKRDKVTLIYNGIPEHNTISMKEDNLRKSLEIPEGRRILLTIGRLTKQKRIDILLDAFCKIIKKEPSCCLLLLGNGPEKDALLNQVKKLKLENSVFFLGFRRDVYDMIIIADIYVCSSEWEAFSISLLEVMLARKPIVAFNVDGVNEAVIDKMNGYLVSFGDIESFTECVLHLLNDNNLAKKMGQYGHQRVLKEFSIKKNISETLCLYERVLTEKGIK